MTWVYMADIRRAKMCAAGARKFFADHGLDWRAFLDTGIDGRALLDTLDPMAALVVEEAARRELAEFKEQNIGAYQ